MKIYKQFICLLLLIGCAQDATVISANGMQVVAECRAENWISCVKKACPNGYDVVKDAYGGVIKCRE